MNIADLLADAYAEMDIAAATIDPSTVTLLYTDHGFSTWACAGIRVRLPSLRADAPPEAVSRYWARITADATGTCPRCYAIADVSVSPEHRVAWTTLPVTVDIPHRDGCGTQFDETERRWFDPEAWTS